MKKQFREDETHHITKNLKTNQGKIKGGFFEKN